MNAQNCAAYKGQDTYYCIKKHEGWSRLDFLSENGCVVYIDFSFNDFRIYYFPVKLSLPFLFCSFSYCRVRVNEVLPREGERCKEEPKKGR